MNRRFVMVTQMPHIRFGLCAVAERMRINVVMFCRVDGGPSQDCKNRQMVTKGGFGDLVSKLGH